jgi:two-component system, OmpR family, osmolarity sensor histidine kinase EnvZ
MTLFPGSLRWRTLAVIVAALVLSQATALWLFDRYVTQPRVMATVSLFVTHVKSITAALQTMNPAQQLEFAGRIAERDGIRILPERSAQDLHPLQGGGPALRMFRERLRAAFGPEATLYIRRAETPDKDGRTRTLVMKLPAGDRVYWLSTPRTRIERDTTVAVVAWGVIGLLIAILATFFLVSRLNRPLGELARAAAQLGRGGDPPPVSVTGPSEIRDVARAFNQMKEDLRRNERERATFLAGVSHDLRTPLARLRLDVEMLDGRVDADTQRGMVADLADMNAIIDQFIDFARSESSEPLSGVNLAELARACAERAARSGIDVRCDLQEVPLRVLRPLAMQRLLDNLLVNAGRHAGGEVELRLRAVGEKIVLSVLDRGPGVPPELVEHLKQPFTRRDAARSGSSGAGLGLAIVERVAVLHGGELALLPREGGGLEARVTLPGPNAS